MAHEFEGRGWQFPIRIDDAGAIAEAREEDKVRQSIEIILRTAPGERVMRPDFGCGIHDLVFDTISGASISAKSSNAGTAVWNSGVK